MKFSFQISFLSFIFLGLTTSVSISDLDLFKYFDMDSADIITEPLTSSGYGKLFLLTWGRLLSIVCIF